MESVKKFVERVIDAENTRNCCYDCYENCDGCFAPEGFRNAFKDADLSGMTLDGMELNFIMNGVNFRNASMKNVCFCGYFAEEADFRGADLRGANFVNAHLRNADFRGAFLEGADFRGAFLEGAVFSEK